MTQSDRIAACTILYYNIMQLGKNVRLTENREGFWPKTQKIGTFF